MDGLINLINQMESYISPYAPGESVLALLAFALYFLLVVGGGLVAVLSGNLVRALVGLVVSFLGVAGMYLLMAAPLMAFMQLLIYVGAVCVLVFFAIMLTKNTPTGEEMNLPGLLQALYGLGAAAMPILVLSPILYLNADQFALPGQPAETPAAELGQGLLESYVLPFEIISIVLLIAMAGGVLLVFEKKKAKKAGGAQ